MENLSSLFVEGGDGLSATLTLCDSIDMCDQDSLAKTLVYMYESVDRTMELLEMSITTEVNSTGIICF